jgi:hypothetical protein
MSFPVGKAILKVQHATPTIRPLQSTIP